MYLSKFARICRKLSFPGKDRLLRLFYAPDNRQDDFITEIIEYDGGLIRVNTSSYLEWYLYFNQYYEPHISRKIKSLVTENSVCLDVGANIGCHTLTMANTAKHGRVYAFEPHPAIFERLIYNLNLNHLKNVAAYNLAISSETGEASLFIPHDNDCNQGKCSMLSSRRRGITKTIKINTTRIRDLVELSNINRCDFIKIDVEGHELICLQELKPLIDEFKPVIIFEYDRGSQELSHFTLEEVADLLTQYRLTDFAGNRLPYLDKGEFSADVLCLPK